MDLSIAFVGTSASAPTSRRGLTSLAIRRGGDTLLFDCGEGTQRQLIKSIGLGDIEHVFLTHFHADHFLGLPGMLKTFALRGREVPITIYGPPGLKNLMRTLEPIYARLPYDLAIEELSPHQAVAFDGYDIVGFDVDHQGMAFGYALVEQERPGRFDEDEARRLGVAPGPAFGQLQRGTSVTTEAGDTVTPSQVLGEARLGRKIVFSGDTAPCEQTRIAAHQADVLIHEASFGNEEVERAAETRHSTARQAAELAATAAVKMLCLTHVSGRYFGKELREEARELFANTELPHDFDVVEVPFPERGDPILIKAARERRQNFAEDPAISALQTPAS